MEPINKPGKQRRGRCKNRKLAQKDGLTFPDVAVGNQKRVHVPKQGLSALHMACLYGQLATVGPLVESMPEWINSGDHQGFRPIHMIMSPQSSPNTSSCLRCLLDHGADINITTDSGATPLHLAASEGLLECTEILVQAGADVLAKDSMGFTPLDLARTWCHRGVARYLRSCMWQKDKEKEMEQRKLVQALYTDIVNLVKLNDSSKKTLIAEKMAEWANKKGFPLLKDFSPRVLVSRYHTQCLLSNHSISYPKQAKHPVKNQPGGPRDDQSTSTRRPPSSSSRPWTIFMGVQLEHSPREPDLRGSVAVWRDGSSRQPQYSTKWDRTPRPAPDLPLDLLERVFFPRAFPSRISSPRDFEAPDVAAVQHRGHAKGRSTSPWTEVAMHLVEVLEPGRY